MEEMRKIRLRIERIETWEPECEVPAHFTYDEALSFVIDERSDEIYDEMSHKTTYEQECSTTIIEGFDLGASDVEDEYGPDGYGDGLS